MTQAPRKIAPADNLADLFNNLGYEEGFDVENKSIWVKEIHQEQIRRLRRKLLTSQDRKLSLYVAGQTGTGKTTALTFLADDMLTQKFHIEHVKAGSVIPGIHLQEDSNIIDMIFVTAAGMAAQDEALDKRFSDRIKKIYDSIKDELVIEEQGKAVNFGNLFTDAVKSLTRFKADEYYRRSVKKIFRYKLIDLIDALEDLIRAHEQKQNKPLLLIIDDWEKARHKDVIDDIFIENMSILRQLNCRKVIAIPAMLQAMDGCPNFYVEDTGYLELKIQPNKLQSAELDGDENAVLQTNRQALRKIVQNRVADNAALIDKDALNLAIDKSGGLPRQFLTILSEACLRALETEQQVKQHHVQETCRDLGNNLARHLAFSTARVDVLKEIAQYHRYTGNHKDVLIECFLTNLIISNTNGVPCYWVNPLIADALNHYTHNG